MGYITFFPENGILQIGLPYLFYTPSDRQKYPISLRNKERNIQTFVVDRREYIFTCTRVIHNPFFSLNNLCLIVHKISYILPKLGLTTNYVDLLHFFCYTTTKHVINLFLIKIFETNNQISENIIF